MSKTRIDNTAFTYPMPMTPVGAMVEGFPGRDSLCAWDDMTGRFTYVRFQNADGDPLCRIAVQDRPVTGASGGMD